MYNLRTLIKYEYKKLLQRKSVWIVTLILMLLTAVSVALPPFMTTVSIDDKFNYTTYEEDTAQRALAADLTGRPIDDALLREMNAVLSLELHAAIPEEERESLPAELLDALPADLRSRLPEKVETVQPEDLTVSPDSDVPYSVKYDDIDYFVDDSGAGSMADVETAYLSDVPLYTDGSDHLYDLRRETNEMIWKMYNLTDDEKAYLSGKEDSLSTPFIYEYCGSYKAILSNTVILAIMISFLTAICIPPVSADEHSRRTDQVILCTRFGRRPAFLAKLITAASFSICAVLLLFASAAVPSFLIYGMEGFQAQIQIALPGSSWDLTMGQAVLILTGISLAAAVLLSCAALLLAEIFKSSIPAAGILIGLLLISSFLNIPEQFRLLSQIWSYCPAKLISVTGSLLEPRLVPFFGTYLASWQFGPFLYLLLSIFFALGGYHIYRRWQAGGR